MLRVRLARGKVIRLAGSLLITLSCLMVSGCFTIEQEIFLDVDGGGDLVLHITLPDFPEDMSKSSLGGMTAGKTNPGDDLAKFKKEVTTGLPQSITVREVKEVKQNGSMGFYAVFHFKDLNDMEAVLANLGKGSLKEGELSGKTEWRMRLDKAGERRSYTGSFFIDVSDMAGAKQGETKKADKPDAGDEIGKQLMPLLLGSVKMRFILHTPSPITETNADIVLRGRTAVWDCSLITFITSKKPVRMTAIY
jgi:hypothetical protein